MFPALPPPHLDEAPPKSEIDTGSDTSDGELDPPLKDMLQGHCKDDGVSESDESADAKDGEGKNKNGAKATAKQKAAAAKKWQEKTDRQQLQEQWRRENAKE